MVKLLEASGAEASAAAVMADVAQVCSRIPPLWDLNNYVAVNPFLGFASEPLEAAARVVADGLGARVLPGVAFYRKRWDEGAFGQDELAAAARRLGHDPATLAAILLGQEPVPLRNSQAVLTFAEKYDRTHGTQWNDAIIRSVARWCAVVVSGGGSHWRLTNDISGLYSSWREALAADRSMEIAGLAGWRDWVNRLPEQPAEAIASMAARLPLSPTMRVAYLYRLLAGLYGWACILRRPSWQAGNDGPGALADLVAIRICADAAVVELAPGRDRPRLDFPPVQVEDESTLLVFQEALEDGLARRLPVKLRNGAPAGASTRPLVQAVFCIDVRSEPLRRHLEAQSDEIETRGFAGFFGVALDWHAGGVHSARCPVLLKPSLCAHPNAQANSTPQDAGKQVLAAPGASFTFVEVLGLAYGVGLVGDALTAGPAKRATEDCAEFNCEAASDGALLPPQRRVDLAAGILKNMGLQRVMARLVLLCGHEGRSANNPHAASLDCGACGGHGGAINARVAAAMLNDPLVRAGLNLRGWGVPEDTHFLPGVHDTSTDQVRLLDTDRVPADHQPDVERLRGWLARAGTQTRSERAEALGLAERPANLLDKLLRRRGRDWSEVRPEWGLARNAVFLAARRCRSRGVDLQGRAFLHEYDAEADPDLAVLSMILSAPVVVASWINLQYFASTVDNETFGCGTKALHNRVGSYGVVLGNGGDLRTGLALQSVHGPDGNWFHEPLRLQVVAEASRHSIEQVLASQRGVKDLVDNGWVRLFALDPRSPQMWRWVPEQGWDEVDATIPSS